METLHQPPTISEHMSQLESHRLMLEQITEGVCGLDLHGNVTFLNRAAAQMLAVDPTVSVGRSFHEVTHHNPSSIVPSTPDACPICRSLRTQPRGTVNHEVFWRPNGASFPVEYSVQSLRSGDADYGDVITFADVTKRQIHSREMLYILTSAKCLLWYADVQYVRPKEKMRWFLWPADAVAAQRFLPFPIAEGQTFAEAYYACRLDEDKTPSDDFGTQEILAGRNYHQEYRCRRADGEIRWIAEDVQIEPIAEDRWRAVGVCTDITELKQREHEIEILNERLQRAMLETHHRVKNNLQIITALIDLQTMDGPATLPLSEFTRLSQHVRSLAAVHDLLTREVKAQGATDSISARSIIEQLLTTIGSATGQRQIRYQIEEGRLSTYQSASLVLIINELVANALKHGRREISLSFHINDGTAIVEVCDDGPGFAADFSPRLAANTGLELIETLTRKDLAGQIDYQNRVEGGARVIIRFPLTNAS